MKKVSFKFKTDNFNFELLYDFKSIKKAYTKLLKKYHPDLFQNKPEKLKFGLVDKRKKLLISKDEFK